MTPIGSRYAGGSLGAHRLEAAAQGLFARQPRRDGDVVREGVAEGWDEIGGDGEGGSEVSEVR